MKPYLETLSRVPLFESITSQELQTLLNCMGARVKNYEKGELILRAGETADFVGIVLSGTVQVIREDFLGNRVILTLLEKGDLFAETFACAGIKKSPVSVLAVTGCTAMEIAFHQMIATCPSSCAYHNRLVENMLRLVARKNLLLNQKVDLMSKRTIRERLSSYFLHQMEEKNKGVFDIPFNRSQLADFLCVDRSAMSRELSKMRDEGLIRYDKNRFELLDPSALIV